MKTLIIYKSIHQGNTKKIAKVIAKELTAKLQTPETTTLKDLEKYDLLGFGSGIYAWRYHQSLLKLVDNLTTTNKKAFIFSTSGGGTKDPDRKALRKKLENKGLEIIGEFNCKGWDKFGPLKLIGGINKGRPDTKDLKQAQDFAKKLKEKLNKK